MIQIGESRNVNPRQWHLGAVPRVAASINKCCFSLLSIKVFHQTIRSTRCFNIRRIFFRRRHCHLQRCNSSLVTLLTRLCRIFFLYFLFFKTEDIHARKMQVYVRKRRWTRPLNYVRTSSMREIIILVKVGIKGTATLVRLAKVCPHVRLLMNS